jgi:hypothetical protein
VDDGRSDRPIDENFQGYGQTMTDGAGGYSARKQFAKARDNSKSLGNIKALSTT